MEDLGELLGRGLLRVVGIVLQALVDALVEGVIRGLARLIYGRGDGPWMWARRVVFRAVALSSSAAATAVVLDAAAPDGWVVLAVLGSLMLLLVMCAGAEERGTPRLVWAAVAALVLLLGALIVRVL